MQRPKRKNERLLAVARGSAFASATFAALSAMHFKPLWGASALALLAGVLGYVAGDLGVLVALASLSVPLMAADPIIGLLFLILGIVSLRYLAADGGRVFLLLALAVAGAFAGPVWATAVLAGFLLGAGEGAVTAALACLTIEVLGLLLGKPGIGATLTGGTQPVLQFTSMPPSLFSAGWVGERFSGLDGRSVDAIVSVVAALRQPLALVAQPVVWASAAAVTAQLSRRRDVKREPLVGIVAAAAGVATALGGSIAVWVAVGSTPKWGTMGLAFVTSLAVALVFIAVWERVFTLEPPARARTPRTSSMAAEDADVDELLRLIATAEDQLASRHTTEKVVMITDMKSFSRMTEEDGSMMTAKAIQRHRDLLLPIIERNGGSGKSTGGDGLVAAFDRPADAVKAASEMQRALGDYNESHPNERPMWVRIGVASGEVVLDKGGRPFIGAALNLAARIMNLADGAQAYVTAEVASAAPEAQVRTHSFGEFELKNIAKPVEVVELLWAPGQGPREPQDRVGTE